MPDASSTSTLDKVTFRDWLLALIGLLFTLAGLLILPTNPKVGIASLALFGPCLALFVHIILRKLRQQKLPQLTATVVGGQPIRPSRARIAKLGAGLLAVGTILIVFRINDKPMFLASVLLIAMTGAVLLVGLATGFLPRTYIQFDPPGLTFGTMRAKATIPWSAITNECRSWRNSRQSGGAPLGRPWFRRRRASLGNGQNPHTGCLIHRVERRRLCHHEFELWRRRAGSLGGNRKIRSFSCGESRAAW
jgi:hypothetical protein